MTEINIELNDESPVEVEFGEVTKTGGGSATSYKPLTDKPQINGITLIGNKSFDDLGLTTVVNAEVDKYVADHKEELKGDPGTPGHDGNDGFSPIAIVNQTMGGAVVTITDKNGTTTATIKNGTDGKTPQKGIDYDDGKPGEDGYSPAASIQQTSTGAVITIVDKSGQSSATISNGKDGGSGVVVNPILSGNEETATSIQIGDEKYVFPQTNTNGLTSSQITLLESVLYSVAFTDASGKSRVDALITSLRSGVQPIPPTPSEKTLESISATKTVTEYEVNDSISYADVVVTAHYSDGTSGVVTSSSSIGTVDSSTSGTKVLEISYTENGVTKTATIDITIKESGTSTEKILEFSFTSGININPATGTENADGYYGTFNGINVEGYDYVICQYNEGQSGYSLPNVILSGKETAEYVSSGFGQKISSANAQSGEVGRFAIGNWKYIYLATNKSTATRLEKVTWKAIKET